MFNTLFPLAGIEGNYINAGRNLLKDRHTEFINIFPVTRAYDVQRSALVQAVVRF